jgi:tetratricopeptide (TPR) repeat protein
MGQGRGLVFLPDMSSSSPPLPIEQPVARDTLVVADFATAAEHGTALVAAGRTAEALPLVRAALQDQPNDPVALLGLVRALTQERAALPVSRVAEMGSPELPDTGADLEEARQSALRLLEVAPASEVGHEALLRVCLAARESECAIREWRAAVHAPDAAARSRILYDLQAPTQRMAHRLEAQMLMPASR